MLMVLQLAGTLGWIERKGSALIQDRIGANRAAIFGFAGAGLVNTLMADPLKFLTKEDVIPRGADRFLHTLAPCVNLFPGPGRLRRDSVRRRAADRRPRHQPAGRAARRRHPVRAGDGLARRLRRRPRRLGLEQPLVAARRHPRLGADDLVRDRHGPGDRLDGDHLRHARPAGDGARAGRARWGGCRPGAFSTSRSPFSSSSAPASRRASACRSICRRASRS